MPEMIFKDLCIELDDCLIISDIHMGYEEALNKQGYLIPRHQFEMTKERLQKVVDRKYSTIIINGDVKHEFGTISDTEWRHTLRVIDFLASRCGRLVLVKGNHDKILGPIADKRNVEVAHHFRIGDALVMHGHELPGDDLLSGVKMIIIGHEHPAVSLADYPRIETYKCFLSGRWQRRDLVVMPSFNLVTEGTNILKERLLSPFLQNGISDFDVHIVSDEVLHFGKVKDLKRLTEGQRR